MITSELPTEADALLRIPEYSIVIEDMVKRYGRTMAADGLSMRVPKSSVYGFVGPNGAGKTTTIRILATLQKPDSGTASICGLDVVRHPAEISDRVGYMPDFFGVYERLTVAEYLDFYGGSHLIPRPKRRRLCDELLELVDLADKRQEQVEVLSRGMKQRLGLARSLIHDPEVLLLDEPASGMDPRARIELKEILRELSRMGKTILISSHILPELAEMCSHVGIIRAGKLIAEGPVQAVIGSLTQGPQLHIRVLNPLQIAQAITVVETAPGCAPPEQQDEQTLTVDFLGSQEDLAHVLTRLQDSAIPVTHFALESSTLEDVFLAVTELGESAG